MNVLFMDIIGIVHTNKFWTKGLDGKPYLKEAKHPKIDGKLNNEQAMQWVSELCEKNNCEIVITSPLHMIFEWKQTFRSKVENALGIDRNLDEWRKLFESSGLRGNVKIVGRLCPDDIFSVADREDEIINFIKKNKVEKFAVLSNQPLHKKYLKNRGIVCPNSGFLEPQFLEAEKILKGV